MGYLKDCRIESQLYSSFVARANGGAFAGGSGNPCELMMCEQAPAATLQSARTVTACHSWPTQYLGETVIAVRCATAGGRAIQCCGHGLLAAAHGWLQRLQRCAIPLLMHGSIIRSRSEKNVVWLQFNRLFTGACAMPCWADQIFPQQTQPVAAAICGDEHGYLVLQWPDNFDLYRLNPQLENMAKNTLRALICTAAQPEQSDEAIQLRYFAPQYGVGEDAATGSAVRVLADYWHPRFQQLSAWQCSARGGVLIARTKDDWVEVGGRCESIGA